MTLLPSPPRAASAGLRRPAELLALWRLAEAQDRGSISGFAVVIDDRTGDVEFVLRFPEGGTVTWSTEAVLEGTEPMELPR